MEEVVEKKAANVYPNPCSGSFSIDFIEESNVNIYNMLGQNVMSLNRVSGTQHISLDNAPKGMYIIQIQSGDELQTKKLIIK